MNFNNLTYDELDQHAMERLVFDDIEISPILKGHIFIEKVLETWLFVISSGLIAFPVKAELSSNQVSHCDHILRVAVPTSPCLC